MVTIESIEQLEGTPHANVFPTDEPKTIRLTLSEGEQIEPHDHPDREIILYLIPGELELRLGEDSYRVDEGDVVHFDGAQDISPSAKRDSMALLVLASKSEKLPHRRRANEFSTNVSGDDVEDEPVEVESDARPMRCAQKYGELPRNEKQGTGGYVATCPPGNVLCAHVCQRIRVRTD